LLTELIRGSYLPNNSIPESRINDVALILEKYIRLKNLTSSEMSPSIGLNIDLGKTKDMIKEKNSLISWIISLAASEIEESLAPNNIKKIVVGNMFDTLTKGVGLPDDLKSFENDLKIQIYLSIARTYLRFDNDMLGFILFKYYNSAWLDLNSIDALQNGGNEKIREIADNIESLKKAVDAGLNHPLIKQLDRITKTYSLYFTILTETIESDPLKIYGEMQKGEKGFVAAIKKTCNQKYIKAKTKLWRSAVRSIVYIFLTKSIFVVAIEVPAIHWFGEPVNPVSLAINIIFPALLLFFIVLTTSVPGENNTNKIISGIKEIMAEEGRKQPLLLRKPRKRKFLVATIFNIIYTSTFFVSMYFVIKGLTAINFNWVSITIFLFFLAFVSFFSIITTKGVKELLIVEKKESFISFLVDLFYLPIIMVGRWLSNNMSKVNIFVFVFDFIIEAPFKIMVDIAEDWTKYVRERRENME